MSMHHPDVPGEDPERHKPAPRAPGRVPLFERLFDRLAESHYLRVTFKFDDREFSFSSSERGETQRHGE